MDREVMMREAFGVREACFRFAMKPVKLSDQPYVRRSSSPPKSEMLTRVAGPSHLIFEHRGAPTCWIRTGFLVLISEEPCTDALFLPVNERLRPTSLDLLALRAMYRSVCVSNSSLSWLSFLKVNAGDPNSSNSATVPASTT